MTRLPQANGSTISSMIVHLHPVIVTGSIVLPGANTVAPISTNISSASLSILNFPPGLTSDYQPTLADIERAGSCDVNPVDLGSRMQPEDQDVVNWLQNWEWELVTEKPEPTSALELVSDNNLAAVLHTTKLSWFELYELGIAFYNYTHDYQTTANFYVEAVKRAHQALIFLNPAAPQVRPILLAMHKTKDILWDGFDQNMDCLSTLYMLNLDLVHWIKPDDSVLEFAYQHGKIGTLECLILMGKTDQAIAAGEKTDINDMTKDEAAEFAWATGHALYLKHRFAQAIPQLTICANDTTSKLCSAAWQLLILALFQSGKVDAAQNKYKQYVHDFHPDSSVIAELSVIFARGESASSS